MSSDKFRYFFLGEPVFDGFIAVFVVFSEKESEFLLHKFIAASPWQQKVQKMYDKEVITTRLTAWYADAKTSDYTSLRRSAPNV